MVPLGSLMQMRDIGGPVLITRYNLYPAASIMGGAMPPVSSGQAINYMQQAASVLRGRRIDPRVRLEVVPASRRQFELAMQDGTMQILSAAGAFLCSEPHKSVQT